MSIMRLSRIVKIFFSITLLCTSLRCAKPTQEVTTLSEAHQKFLKVCQEDAKLKPVIKLVENTLYVYLPVEHQIMSTKANGMTPTQSSMSKNAQTVLFVDGQYLERRFNISYDISPQKSYPNEFGYGYVYNEEYYKKDAALFQALLKAYGDLDQTHLPGDVEFESHAKTVTHEEVVHFKGKKLSPDFIVLVVADIKNGIVVEKTFHFSDYKLTAFGTIPSEEFSRRQLIEVYGNSAAIADTKGEHIDYKEITWPDFLARQIIRRAKYQYQQSAFPPKGDATDAILQFAHDTFSAYDFEDFDAVKLTDLASGKTYLFDKNQLTSFVKK